MARQSIPLKHTSLHELSGTLVQGTRITREAKIGTATQRPRVMGALCAVCSVLGALCSEPLIKAAIKKKKRRARADTTHGHSQKARRKVEQFTAHQVIAKRPGVRSSSRGAMRQVSLHWRWSSSQVVRSAACRGIRSRFPRRRSRFRGDREAYWPEGRPTQEESTAALATSPVLRGG